MSHALLAPSAAERWLKCTPSARMEEKLPDPGSVYAEEGTLAHAIAELKATKYTTPMKPTIYRKRMKELEKHSLYQLEMDGNTEHYLDYIKKICHSFKDTPYLAVEKKLDLTAYIPGSFGTSDFIAIADKTLYVIDYKHGKGVPVSAEDNAQMKCYALGAYTAYCDLFDIQEVVMTIVQPRLDSLSEARMTALELLAWGEYVKPLAQKAWKGEGDCVPGDHCRFCRAKALCRARADGYTALEDFGFAKPPLLSDDEVGDLITRGRILAKWVSDLEEYALSTVLQGGTIAGWKAVPGRSTRQWTDQEKAFKALIAAGINEAILYERKPVTLAAIEKVVGKKDFEAVCASFIEKPEGKPTLAQDNDPRDPVQPISANADFGNTDF